MKISHMNIGDTDDLFVAYNDTEDFRLLVRADSWPEAAKIVSGYYRDSHMHGAFEIHQYNEEDAMLNVDCDYILTKA